jgi:uncharacterized protein (DUF58 family)
MDLLKRLDPRLPPRTEPRLRLGLQTLYILPTGLGWLWLGGLGLLLMVGVQTQTNGPLLLAFLMLGLWLLALHLTHFNLHGLELASGIPSWGFAEESVPYPLRLRSSGLCEGVCLNWVDAAAEPLKLEALRPGEHSLNLPWRPPARGAHRPGRLRLMSTAPLGLFVCWTVWSPPAVQLIAPARKAGPVKELVNAAPAPMGRGQAHRLDAGGDDWHDLRPRRPEDSPSRLAWKLVAQGRGHQVKRFTDTVPQVLVIAADPALPRERALQHLSERLCRLHRQGLTYGLLWQGAVVGPDEGLAHRDRCLRLLAEAP